MFIAATVASPVDPTPQINAGYGFRFTAALRVILLTSLACIAVRAASSTSTRLQAPSATASTTLSRLSSTTRSSPPTREGRLVAPRFAFPPTAPTHSSIPAMVSTMALVHSSCTSRRAAVTETLSPTMSLKTSRVATRRPSGLSGSSVRRRAIKYDRPRPYR